MEQINDICPHCKNKKLQYCYKNEPYTLEHLQCPECDSTYNIKYSQMWMEDVNNLAGDTCDYIEKRMEDRGMHLRDDVSDEIFDAIHIIMEKYSTQDYKNHN
jgi:transcription elongation factor Elf1